MAKKEYTIGIEQTRYKEFKVEADSPEEALRTISDAYFKEAIECKYWFLNVLENS